MRGGPDGEPVGGYLLAQAAGSDELDAEIAALATMLDSSSWGHSPSTYTTIERVATRLLEFSERFGREDEAGTVHITLPLSQEELAGATGASLESIGRALQTMRGLQCIETRRREIRIIDPRGLASLCADA
jgi:CRP-like cAMP-binding protein